MQQGLTLSVKPGNWQQFIKRRLSPAFQRIAKRIWSRDEYTCQYCGFQARDFQDVVNIDQNYENNKASNLATACCFCSQCFFLESAGLDDQSGGQLIYLPEISQQELNAFCHVIFATMVEGSQYQDSAQTVYRMLKLRHKTVETAFGAGTSEPRLMGGMIMEYEYKHNKKISNHILEKLRLLPIHTKFHTQLKAWTEEAAKELAK